MTKINVDSANHDGALTWKSSHCLASGWKHLSDEQIASLLAFGVPLRQASCESQRESKVKNKKRMLNPSALHLLAGGFGATAGACVTSPLDVVQTRLQSTLLSMNKKGAARSVITVSGSNAAAIAQLQLQGNFMNMVFSYMRFMVYTEGIKSLFKGLLPSVLGIAPAKAVYFFVYSSTKNHLNSNTQLFVPHGHLVHSLSAIAAGITTSTVTNPVWFIKTRLQLDNSRAERWRLLRCISTAYKDHGLVSFFRGLSASYVGVLETMIYFIIYEDIKKYLRAYRSFSGKKNSFHTADFVFASVFSKVTATLLMYPHEVVRTRLRQDVVEEGSGRLKYRNFFQTLIRVGREEGRLGLYGGFATNICRQVPNTAVTFLTYESIVHFLGEQE